MEIQTYVDKIKQEQPDFSYEKVEVFEDGRGHHGIMFDREKMYRFSKRDSSIEKEHKLLGFLHDKIDARIPESLYLSKDKTRNEENVITGLKLRELPDKNELDEILTQIALFLKQLHAIPRKGLKNIGYEPEVDNSGYVRHMKEKVTTHLDQHIDQSLKDDIFSFVEKAFAYIHPDPCLIHGDMNGKNIFWNSSLKGLKKLGVIDFDDVQIFDPAKDFCHIGPRYGNENLEKMLAVYGKVDDGFRDRIEMHYKRARLYVCIDHIVRKRKRSVEEVVQELLELYGK